jgi:heme exporter protein D
MNWTLLGHNAYVWLAYGISAIGVVFELWQLRRIAGEAP